MLHVTKRNDVDNTPAEPHDDDLMQWRHCRRALTEAMPPSRNQKHRTAQTMITDRTDLKTSYPSNYMK
jgi:hypothetical protein